MVQRRIEPTRHSGCGGTRDGESNQAARLLDRIAPADDNRREIRQRKGKREQKVCPWNMWLKGWTLLVDERLHGLGFFQTSGSLPEDKYDGQSIILEQLDHRIWQRFWQESASYCRWPWHSGMTK